MKFVVIDTETTGLFDFKQPADAPGQPRMAQFGAIYCDDIEGPPIRTTGIYVKPDGWQVPSEASKVNGLSTEFLHDNGRPVAEALDIYVDAIKSGRIIVAFNAQFDCKVTRPPMRSTWLARPPSRPSAFCVAYRS
jgi:DNA polymerase-3 subunit epsilon